MTTNGGVSWSNVQTGDFQEVEIHPSNSTIIYAVRKNGTRTEFLSQLIQAVVLLSPEITGQYHQLMATRKGQKLRSHKQIQIMCMPNVQAKPILVRTLWCICQH